MPFSLRMAWRETRAGWRHFIYFFACITVGVGALVGVTLFASILEQTVTREARALHGGDLQIRLSQPMSPEGKSVLQSLDRRGIAMTHVSELVAMAALPDAEAGNRTQIVELKAIEVGYPLYGGLGLEPDRPLPDLLDAERSVCALPGCFPALVQQSFLIRMGLSVGDEFKIGKATFIINGLIRKEPDRIANAFSFGPRVMVSREGLAAADLVKPGSRIRERYLLRVPPTIPLGALIHELRGRLGSESARLSTYRNAQPALKRFLDQLGRYLGLIGLTALFVGGIGVATTVHAFIREKMESVAVLKTLGAESNTVVRTYLVQALLLGLLGCLAGAALGVGLQAILPALLRQLFAVPLLDQVSLSGVLTVSAVAPIVKGMAMGLLITLLFTSWPLLAVREIRPALILRREIAHGPSVRGSEQRRLLSRLRRVLGLDDRLRLLTASGIGVGLMALAIWQAGSWRIGLLFIGALIAAVVLLLLISLLFMHGLRHLPGSPSLAVRQAIRNLHRPGSHAAGVLVSIGIGVMLIVAAAIMERSLLEEVGASQPDDAPSFFFIDIQPDQRDGFRELVERWTGGASPEVTPLVRSRLHAVDGRRVRVEKGDEQVRDREQLRKRWYFTREYVLTFLQDLPKDNEVTQGQWWESGARPPKPLVSVEAEAAKHLGVRLGSILEFDIQGTIVAAEVRSIRKVDWGSFSTNFYMIVSPGALDDAPFTYVGTIQVSPEEEVPLQEAVVAEFPNVTAINIGEVLDNFARILDRLSLAIRSIALFCVIAGACVMAAALSATKYRRLYESGVLKALGATRGLIARCFAAEYALLGFVAGVVGVLLASGLSWGVVYFFLDIPLTVQPGVLLAGCVLTVVLALAVGFLSTFRILGHPPLAVLRHE